MASLSLPLCLLALAFLASLQDALASPTPGKLDQVNVDDVLKNKRLFDNYVKCVLEKGPCSAEGTELKTRLPKEVENQCAGCSDTEKDRIKKVVKHLRDNRKDVWEEFKSKYDPDNKWKDIDWINA